MAKIGYSVSSPDLGTLTPIPPPEPIDDETILAFYYDNDVEEWVLVMQGEVDQFLFFQILVETDAGEVDLSSDAATYVYSTNSTWTWPSSAGWADADEAINRDVRFILQQESSGPGVPTVHGDEPLALFTPGTGQYWLIFGAEAFVLTINGTTRAGMSWSRYTFPYAIDDWTIMDGDLYLRAGDRIWLVDEETLLDDAVEGEYPDIVEFEATLASREFDTVVTSRALDAQFDPAVVELDLGGPVVDIVESRIDDGYFLLVISGGLLPERYTTLRVETSTGTIDLDLTDPDWSDIDPSESQFRWNVVPWELTDVAEVYTVQFIDTREAPPDVGEDIIGYMSWPYLDMGQLGRTKMMVGFDLVVDGEVDAQFGYDQRNENLVTPSYILDGDTLLGDVIPMPLSAPSVQMRLTFSANQKWEWNAAVIYLDDNTVAT
jgi:hypothetical protein